MGPGEEGLVPQGGYDGAPRKGEKKQQLMPDLGAKVSAFSSIVSAARSQQHQNTPFYWQKHGISPSLTGCAVLRSSALAVRLGEESVGLLGPRMKSRLYLWMLIGGAWDVFRSVSHTVAVVISLWAV